MLQRILCAIMVVVGLLAHSNTCAADEANKLELPPKSEVEKGTAQLQLPISLTNAVPITGFQCDLYLPDGFTILADEYGDYLIDLARTTPKRHNLATREMPDGALRIVLSSMTNATFSGNSGAVLSITLAIGKDVAAGSYDVNLKNVVLTDPSATRYPSSDVSGTIVVKESEVVISEEVKLEVSPEITTEKGVSEFQMPILLTNKEDITGFQCDLYLPDGFSVAKDEYDDYLIDVARTTTKRHSIAIREMPDGALRIVLSSMINATFSGNSGAVLNVTVRVGNDIALGSYNVNLKNIVLTDPQAKRYTSADVTGMFTVTEPALYTLTYMVNGEVYQSFSIKYRDVITPLAFPTKEGYTFSGWSEIPATMPAKDVIVKGYFTINSYTITYMLDGEVYTTETLEYEAKIVPPVIPGLEEYTIWEDVPETMPAGDITIYGKAKDIIDSLAPVLSKGKGDVYDPNGRKLNSNVEIQNSKLKKGINIIRMSDGTIRKILVK